jgi:fibronectin-binding autotransporter adhesin
MKLRHSIVFGSALLAFATTSKAAALTWDGGGSPSVNWSTAANWNTPSNTDATPISSSDITFNNTVTGALNTTMGAAYTVSSLNFTSAQTSAVTINTDNTKALTIGGAATTDISVQAGNHTFIGTNGGSGTAGDLFFTNATTNVINIANNASLTIQARIRNVSGNAVTMQKTGLGTLVLAGNNGGTGGWTLTNPFEIQGGVLRFASASAYGNSGNKYTVSSGAAMELMGAGNQSNATGTITLNGTGIGSNGALRSISGTNGITNGGSIVLNTDSSIGVDAGSLSIANAISGASKNLTKVGAGTLTLSSTANTYSGETIIKAGTLKLNAANTIDSSSKITVGDAGSSSTVLDVTTAGLTVSSGKTLAGIGTVNGTGQTVTINGTHAVGNAGTAGGVGTQTVTATTLAYGNGSIFEWDINTATATYDKVALTGSLTVDSTGVFKVVSSTDFTDGFWNTTMEWTDIFGSSSLAGFDVANFVYVANGSTVTAGSFASEGSFSINTNTLKWTAVPEPTSALAGLLLGAGLLRRRRKGNFEC